MSPPASNLLLPLREGPASSTSLVRALQLPRPTLNRALQNLQRSGEVMKVGAPRGARYALPRMVAGAGSTWPVYQVDPAGRVHQFGRLDALMPRHFHFETPHAALRGLTEGLPWFLHALKPSGFLARASKLPPRAPTEAAGACADDADLAWFTREGWDAPGDLIVGAEALEAWRAARAHRAVIDGRDRPRHYMRRAEAVLEGGGHASAQMPGDSPKFTALTDHGGHRVHVVVKFSPPLDTPEGQRAGERLFAEHLAHVYLNARGVCAVHSRVFRFGGRIFLEVDRFDRVGAEGRRAVASLASLGLRGIDGQWGWSQAAAHLASAGVLPKNDARQIRLMEAFSALIGNRQRQADDLGFFHRPDGRLALAPAYDITPAVFHGEGVVARFEPPSQPPILADVWLQARRLAEGFWERLAAETQFSTPFRESCAQALKALRSARPEQALAG